MGAEELRNERAPTITPTIASSLDLSIRVAPTPENVCARLLSLLQSPLPETFSAIAETAQKASFRAVLHARLGVPRAERYANSLSERRTLSGAWGLADLVYKLFPEQIQWPEKLGSVISSYPVRLSDHLAEGPDTRIGPKLPGSWDRAQDRAG